MSDSDSINFEHAMQKTKIVRLPQQKIFTFWETSFSYRIVSSAPAGEEPTNQNHSVVSSGNFQCAKPIIITRQEEFEQKFPGFDEVARQFANERYEQLTNRLVSLGYHFQNSFEKQSSSSLSADDTLDQLLKDSSIDKQTTAIILTESGYEHIGLVRAAMEMIMRSAPNNFLQLQEHGLLDSEEDRRRSEIEILFYEAENMGLSKEKLGKKLQQYGLFEEYEDRFFKLFRF